MRSRRSHDESGLPLVPWASLGRPTSPTRRPYRRRRRLTTPTPATPHNVRSELNVANLFSTFEPGDSARLIETVALRATRERNRFPDIRRVGEVVQLLDLATHSWTEVVDVDDLKEAPE